LFYAKSEFVIARLVLASTFYQVLKGDFLAIRSPSMRKYSILGNVIPNTIDQAELSVIIKVSKDALL